MVQLTHHVKQMSVKMLIQEIAAQALNHATQEDVQVSHISCDSRQVTQGTLFCACKGLSHDGHDFISRAVAKGANAILVQHGVLDAKAIAALNVPVYGVDNVLAKLGVLAACFYAKPSAKMQLHAVTGTNGKTTVAYLLAQAIDALGHKCAYMGTIGNGFLGDMDAAQMTTSDAITLQANLASYAANQASDVALEVSSHALHQYRVDGCDFNSVIFTNLTQDHLDYHGTLEDYAQAKARLFQDFKADVAVLNMDDAFVQNSLLQNTAKQSITYGEHADAMLRLDAHIYENGRNQLQISWQGKSYSLQTTLVGRFNALNILAVCGVLLAKGYDMQEIQTIVPKLHAPAGRMQSFNMDNKPLVVVDYAHTPDALEQVLMTLREICTGQLIVCFGCGGNRDKGKRAKMGFVANHHADCIWLTDDNPRHESPQAIVADILSGIESGIGTSVHIEHERSKAIAKAIYSAAQDDVVLIAGKGHESYQLVGDTKIPFDDAKHVALALEVAP